MWGRSESIKEQHVAQGLSVNTQLAASMKLYQQSVSKLAFLSLVFVMITVRRSHSSFVPGRCLCQQMQPGVRGQLKDLTVFPPSPSCNKVTVIVTLKRTSEAVCLNPEAPLGKQLIRCWNRSHKLGRNVMLCLKRRRRGRGRQRQRSGQRNRGQSRGASASSSQ